MADGDGPRDLRIPGFEILEPLGFGGMGEVFRARQTSLKREVALKILKQDVRLTQEASRRFERETAIQVRLSHPNLAKVYDGGVADGISYIAMEVVDGKSLKTLIHEGEPLGVAMTLTTIRYLVEALIYLHSEKVLHRDLKPSNVLLSERGEVKLIDFGLATMDHVTPITDDRDLLGTPYYMAPETFLGAPHREETDIFGLGMVFFECLTGNLPHEPTHELSEWMSRVIREPPRDVSFFRPDVSRAVADLVNLLLRKNPADRPRAKNVLERIDQILARMNISPRPATVPGAPAQNLFRRPHSPAGPPSGPTDPTPLSIARRMESWFDKTGSGTKISRPRVRSLMGAALLGIVEATAYHVATAPAKIPPRIEVRSAYEDRASCGTLDIHISGEVPENAMMSLEIPGRSTPPSRLATSNWTIADIPPAVKIKVTLTGKSRTEPISSLDLETPDLVTLHRLSHADLRTHPPGIRIQSQLVFWPRSI